ncbi:MAG: hypothetical protein WA040_07390 [Anaerolineae bacterium]
MSNQTPVDGPLFPALDPALQVQQRRADDALVATLEGQEWAARARAEQQLIAETPPLPFGYILASGGLPPR